MEGFGINIDPGNSNLTECCLFAEKKNAQEIKFHKFLKDSGQAHECSNSR